MTVIHRWLVPLIVTAHAVAASADQATDKQQQSTIARWTAEKICEMGVDAFYALPDSALKTMFERDTSMLTRMFPTHQPIRKSPVSPGS